jgi:hypothetical protein
MTAEQIVSNSDANIERIKKELNLTPEQEKHWAGFNSAMHYLGHNGADRLKLRVARAKRDPPDDIIEQMRNEPSSSTTAPSISAMWPTRPSLSLPVWMTSKRRSSFRKWSI